MSHIAELAGQSGLAGEPKAAAPSAIVTGIRSAGIVLAGSALVAVCAHVSIPLWFTPVPITLQPFAVLLLGLVLGPRLAFGSMIAYLAEGAAGLPVFTPSGLGGVAQLLGPTGGYLMSYPIVAPVVSVLWRNGRQTFARGVVVAGAGNLLILGTGGVWLGMLAHLTAPAVIDHAILPFLPGDVLKVCAAAGIAAGLNRWRRGQA